MHITPIDLLCQAASRSPPTISWRLRQMLDSVSDVSPAEFHIILKEKLFNFGCVTQEQITDLD